MFVRVPPLVAFSRLSVRRNAHALDAARIGIEYFEFEQAGPGDQFAAQRQPSGARDQITAERIDFLGGVADVEVVADNADDVLDLGARIGDVGAVGLTDHVGAFVFVMLVGDVTDDLLDNVLDRDDAVGAAILVDDQGQMDLFGLHPRQRSMTRADGGTNKISRTILATDSGMARSSVLKSSAAGSGFLRLAFFSGSTAARAVTNAIKSRM